jgi:hypothetical protein
MTALWRIEGDSLKQLDTDSLRFERNIHDWIEENPRMIDEDLMIIGREVEALDRKRIDLLGLTREGHLTIIELKRDKTPRDIVGQVLEYASWVATLKTPDVIRIAEIYLNGRGGPARLQDAFRAKFNNASLPEELNSAHRMLIVATSLDDTSKRIVQYLSEVHDVPINTAFFNVFSDGGQQYLSADWLMDQTAVDERVNAKTRAPWSGLYYVNILESSNGRRWEDMASYGFISAGGGSRWSSQLKRLHESDGFYAHVTGAGYVGYGIVTGESVPASEFKVGDVRLFDLETEGDYSNNSDDSDKAEYVVPVKWLKKFAKADAKKFPGYFAATHVVCKLRQPETLDYLAAEFGDPHAA